MAECHVVFPFHIHSLSQSKCLITGDAFGTSVATITFLAAVTYLTIDYYCNVSEDFYEQVEKHARQPSQ